MKITNKLNLPVGFVKAVSTERHNKPGTLSATTLLKGTKEILLTERHWDEMTDDASERVWATFGTAVHSVLEKSANPTDQVEMQLEVEVNGILITGRIDCYDKESRTITDWKTASVWKVKMQDFSDWYRQGILYAWLLRENGYAAKKCRFVALLKDHSKSKARLDRQYPASPCYVYEFDVGKLDMIAAEGLVQKKVEEYLRYRDTPDDEIPPCLSDERWAEDEKWAVVKTGRKSAVRLFASEKEAAFFCAELTEKGEKGYSVEYRPGQSRKCLDYCAARAFCDFARQHAGGTEGGEA